MTKPSLLLLALATGALAASPASARVHHRHHLVRANRGLDVPTFGNRRDVLETNRLGDHIISGRIGLHHDPITNAMVPDSDGPGFIATGRESRGGVAGANGVPGLKF